VRWTFVTHVGGRNVYGVWVGRPKSKRPLERSRRRRNKILKLTSRRQRSMERSGFSWLRIGSSGGLV
jgi:hypothetical protein